MSQLQSLVAAGFDDWQSLGDVYAKRQDDLILFNYSPLAAIHNRWNWFERVSRGLILDARTGTTVARPFDKFFNWGEGGRMTDAPIRIVTEKMDGSLGIGFWHNDQWHVATRGSFDGEQAQWATERLRRRIASLNGYAATYGSVYGTLLFEIIYPENRIVVDYGDRAELVLLAMRWPTGQYAARSVVKAAATSIGVPVVEVHSFDTPADIVTMCAQLDANHEGFVAEFDDGQRFKFKGDVYRELHRLINGLTWNRAVEVSAAGTVDEARRVIPDEFLNEFDGWIAEIEAQVAQVVDDVEVAFAGAPNQTRRVFAMWVNETHPKLAPYLFARLDGRDYRPMIYRRESRQPDHIS